GGPGAARRAPGGNGTSGGAVDARGAVSGTVTFDTDNSGILAFSGKVGGTGWKASVTAASYGLDKATGVLSGEITFDGKTMAGGGILPPSSQGDKGTTLEVRYQGGITLADGSVVAGEMVRGLESLAGNITAKVDYKGRMARLVTGETVGATEYSGTVGLLSGNIRFGDRSLGVEGISGKVKGNGTFSGRTAAGPLEFDPKNIAYQGKVVLEGADVKITGGPLAPVGPISGRADGEITFEANAGEMPRYRGAIRLADGKVVFAPPLKQPVTGVSMAVAFSEGMIRVREARGYLGASPVEVVGDVWPGPRPRLKLNISSPAMDLSTIEAGALIPGLTSLQGTAHVDLTVAGYLDSLSYTGMVRISDGAFSHSMMPLPLSHISASFILNGTTLEVREFSGRISGATFAASGDISNIGGDPFIDVNMDVKALPISDLRLLLTALRGVAPLQGSNRDRANLGRLGEFLRAEGSLDLALAFSGRMRDPVAHGRFSVAQVKAGGTIARDVKGDIAYRNGAVGIYNFAARVAGGYVRGDARFSFPANGGAGTPAIRASISLDSLSLDRVDMDSVISSGRGGISWLKGISGVAGGKAVISVDNDGVDSIASITLKSASYEGIAFDTVEARLRLKDDTLYLDKVKGQGQGAMVAALGTIDLAGLNIDLDVSGDGINIAPLVSAFTKIKGRPVTGTGGFVGTISGPLDSATFTGLVELRDGTILGQRFYAASGYLNASRRGLSAERIKVMAEGGTYLASGRLVADRVDLDISIQQADVRELAKMAGVSLDAGGSARGRIKIAGLMSRPEISGDLRLEGGSFAGLPVDRAGLVFDSDGDTVRLRSFDALAVGGKVSATGTIRPGKGMDLDVSLEHLSLRSLATRIQAVRGRPGLIESLSGSATFRGKVGGTLKNPLVKGQVTVGEFSLYGASFASASGVLTAGKGSIEVSPLVISDRDGGVTVAGRIETGGKGRVDLEVRIDDLGAGDMAALLSGGKITSLPGRVNGIVSVRDGVFSLQSLRIDQKNGCLTAGGTYDPRGKVGLRVTAKSLDVGAILRAAGGFKAASGLLDMTAVVEGSSKSPTATFTAHLRNGNVGQVYFDEVSGEINYRDGRLFIANVSLAQGAHRARLKGSLPVPGRYLAVLGITPPARVEDMDVALEMDQANLMLLALMSDGIEWARGIASVNLRLAGSLDKPEIYGRVRTSGSEIKYRPLADAITDVAGDLEFCGGEVLVHALRGRIRGGGISGQGRVILAGLRPSYVDLSVAANGLPVISSFAAAVVNGTVRVRGPSGLPLISGDIDLKKAEINPFALRAPAGQAPLDARLALDLNLGSDARLLAKDLDAGISGKLHIGGTISRPAASGIITARKGTFIYFGTEFTLTDGRAEFIEFNGLTPELEIHGETRISGTRVMLTLAGKPDSLTMHLSSEPPMRQEEIVALLNYPAALARALKGDVEGAVKDEILKIIDQELRLQVVGSVERALRQALSLDDVKLERDDANKLTLRLGKYVVDNLYISYNAPLSPEAKGAFKLEYLFSPGIIFSSRFEDEGHYSFGLEARLRF
ncbi:MAG TPA: hypothetical protein GX506_01585, partial [Firmicutes bacterium]|nr:hypothetical protein [Bacillota bacterium]